MKASTEAAPIEPARRGLFRRSRRTEDTATTASDATLDAVAQVDELARRMDELTSGRSLSDDPVRAQLDMQRAVIARANDIAASGNATTTGVPTITIPSVPTPTNFAMNVAPEASMQQPAPIHTDDAPMTSDDFEARLDAALQPVALPVADSTPTNAVTLEPTAAPAVAAAAPAAEFAPLPTSAGWATATPLTQNGDSAAQTLGIDVHRIVQLIEDEAVSVQTRMQLEVQTAHAQAEDIVDRAESEAERIREHGQAQARVLLGEVEEIISEAQQTGEQILLRANDESVTLRKDATAVLQQAQTEARAIIETARREGEQVLAEQRRLATVRAQEAMREQDRLKDQIRRLEERRRQVLESLEPLISQLTQMMPAGIDQNVVSIQRQQQR